MIVFINFAPIKFMGGSEKYMLETATKINKLEKTMVVDVSEKIANLYGKIILNRTFDSHKEKDSMNDSTEIYTIGFLNFIPLTNEWYETTRIFKEARLVYVRFEVLEIFLCFYFGGYNILKKVIAGLILSPVYFEAKKLSHKIHNLIYNSRFYGYLLKNSKKVHVLNKRDERYIKKLYSLKNLIYIPIGFDIKSPEIISQKNNNLNIIYVGELSYRKGVDIIIKVIKESSPDFEFHIVGDGPLKKDLIQLSKSIKNCKVYGYITNKELTDLYTKADVIIFPSRGESFGMAMVEGMFYGLRIVNASEVSLELPHTIETSIENQNINEYIKTLISIHNDKKNNKLNKQNVISYANDNFSNKVTDQLFMKDLLSL